MDKKVLDPCCATKSMWFDKNDLRCHFADSRKGIMKVSKWKSQKGRPRRESQGSTNLAVRVPRQCTRPWTAPQCPSSSERPPAIVSAQRASARAASAWRCACSASLLTNSRALVSRAMRYCSRNSCIRLASSVARASEISFSCLTLLMVSSACFTI